MSDHKGPPTYVCACACGEVCVHLYGEPMADLSADCYCNDCNTGSYYLDQKASKENKKNISLSNGKGGISVSAWLLGNISVVKGKDKLRGFKLWSCSPLVRTYTSCCSTSIIFFGHKGAPRWRAFNRNCIKKYDTSSPLVPKVTYSIMGKYASKKVWEKVPAANKYSLIPWLILPKILSILLFPWFWNGSRVRVKDEDRKVPGLFIDSKEVTELVPPETYVAAGFDIPKCAQK